MTGSVSSHLFTFDAIAQSYSQVQPQIELLEQSPFVSSVTVSSAKAFQSSSVISESVTPVAEVESTGVSFTMSVVFTPELFTHQQLRSYGTD
jgi:hypothetical protein